MDKWIGWLLPIVASIISSIFAASYFIGRNIERASIAEDKQKALEAKVLELLKG